MKKISKSTITVLVVIFCVLFILGSKFFYRYSKLNDSSVIVDSRKKGNPAAELRIIEYIDFECPACAQGSEILNQYIKKYPDKIYMEVKYYPLDGHRHAFMSARYAECAAKQGKFWPFFDLLVKRQDQWKKLTNAESAFQTIAKEVEMDFKKLDHCMQDDEVDEVIVNEKIEGKSLGIQSTPTYFINEKMVVGTKSLTTELMSHFKEIGG